MNRLVQTLVNARLVSIQRGVGNTAWYRLTPEGRHLIKKLYFEFDQSEHIGIPATIPVSDIGVIERDLPNLRMVIVIADKVERPASLLSEAVEQNFIRGVKYLFLVSADRTKEEDGYYKLFEQLAKIVIKRGLSVNKKLEELIQIQSLPYKWEDYPHIFYRIELPEGGLRTLAFRGDKRKTPAFQLITHVSMQDLRIRSR